MSRHTLASLIAAATLSAGLPTASADSYPSKPITIVVPFGPGSGTDVVSRFYARALKDRLDATAVVELKPGAAGMIGGQHAARSAPDGYTVLMGSGTVNAANYPFLRGQIHYAPQDFAVVSTIYVTPPLLLAAKDVPGRTIKEIIDRAQQEKRRLSCGSGNAVTQVACELLKRKTGADIVNVPYKGNAQSVADLASGQIAIAFSDMAAAGPLVARGAVRQVAVPMASRFEALPDVPTLAEQGIPDFEFMSWNTIFVPAGTPMDVIRKLNEAARYMLGTPEWEAQRLAASGIKVSGELSESKAFVDSEIARWERYIKETGVKGTP